MSFVKLDACIFESTLWADDVATKVFITALLMAKPFHLKEPAEALKTREIAPLGYTVPPGDYGFVDAAGIGIIRRAMVHDEPGYGALDFLAGAEAESRTTEHDGRRMVRINGGFLVLNFDKYREKDHTAAERMRRMRERKSQDVTRNVTVVTRNVTQAEAEAEAEAYKTPSNSPKGEEDGCLCRNGSRKALTDKQLDHIQRKYPQADVRWLWAELTAYCEDMPPGDERLPMPTGMSRKLDKWVEIRIRNGWKVRPPKAPHNGNGAHKPTNPHKAVEDEAMQRHNRVLYDDRTGTIPLPADHPAYTDPRAKRILKIAGEGGTYGGG